MVKIETDIELWPWKFLDCYWDILSISIDPLQFLNDTAFKTYLDPW